jgi:RNA polymerase sigma-70 factor, ECF subfamily
MDVDQAVARLKQGDLESMEGLVTRYYLPAVRAAYLIVHEKGLAEDVVQNTFLDLPNTIRQFDPKRPFRAWFLRCVVNAAINTSHRETRLLSLDQGDESNDFSVESWLLDQNPGPEEQYEEAEKNQAIFQALGLLTLKQRAAVVMRYYLEMSESEMAEKLESPKSSLKWWLYSARVRLHNLLQTFEPANDLSDAGEEKRR